MVMRIESATIDARDVATLSRWWADALGWSVCFEADDEVCVSPGGDPEAFPQLTFVAVEHPERGRQRVHLDLASDSLEQQRATVARLEAAGARRTDVGQGDDAAYVVLADPEGNAFCVLDPREEYRDTGALAAIVLAVDRVAAVREVWELASGWEVTSRGQGYLGLRRPGGGGAVLELIERPDLRQHGPRADDRKNRTHVDVRPVGEDQAAVVERLLAAGATREDVGQGPDATWVVLADAEGNELCVLSRAD